MTARLVRTGLPGRFIQDCEECGCDVGDYDARTRKWQGTPEQLEELRDRAEHYTDPAGPDAAPAGLKVAAQFLLKALRQQEAR